MPVSETLNPVQLHLLDMFRFCKSDLELLELKDVLAAYYAQKVQEEADRLWDDGTLDADAIERIGKEHWRTPYKAL
ncbi:MULTISPECIES: hypothetical protein [unclassified Fibrobacter]|uniref:hypothetical protein n=1 Tax=unclassified Fibrobacter TaxID=2634177 RepID=UPI000C70F7E3|nr:MULTISPECIES: hypothetical protein [unclassified Fibrobacter]MCQ2105094.1 hypothetical protein [Fibrobacter sp.]PWJ56025.1 hypothetical protein BGX12_1645 [Fibrobacter sp. UWR4]PZW63717.1 hypothetical protein C8E88_104223 [Fibrobacter sp. UWR1]